MSDAVLIEKRGAALWLTINRPDKRNAINTEVVAGLAAGYEQAHADDDVRVIVLTGAGDKAFCAGGDLNPGAAFVFDFSQPSGAYADLLRRSQAATKPAVARINGVCMAGGMGLLCMADMAIATDDAIFGLPEVKIGVFPMQVLSLLQRLAPPRVVREWCLTGEPFDAKAAREAGLVNHIVPRAELDAGSFAALLANLAEGRALRPLLDGAASALYDELSAHSGGNSHLTFDLHELTSVLCDADLRAEAARSDAIRAADIAAAVTYARENPLT